MVEQEDLGSIPVPQKKKKKSVFLRGAFGSRDGDTEYLQGHQ
jgi:hypothetical protein